jgi:hypothetical protein
MPRCVTSCTCFPISNLIFCRDIDRSNGKVTILNGNLFYSPNCSHPVNAPPPDWDHGSMQNVFKTVSSHKHPRWWNPAFGWLSFIPINPSYKGVPFSPLAHILTPEQKADGRYALSDHTVAHWARLEDTLIHATSPLAKHFNLAAVHPYSPWAYGYHYGFQISQTSHRQFMLTQDWFTVWMELFSFVVASSEAIAAEKQEVLNKSIPRWFEVLADAGFDQTWLVGVNLSTICSFQPNTSCTGAFVSLFPSDRQQPMIPWFCSFHVPVWYRWGRDEVQAITKNPELVQFAPLPEQLQSGTTLLTWEPLGKPSMQGHGIKQSTEDTRLPMWQDFFTVHDALNAQNLALETSAHRQQCLQREQQPPTTSAKVYKWTPSMEDPNVLARQPVAKDLRFETLYEYPAAQKQYDSWRNEWDCCTAFQLDAILEEDMYNVVTYTATRADTINPNDQNLSPPRVSSPFGPLTSPVRLETNQERLPPSPAARDAPADNSTFSDLATIYECEAVEILALHYRFVPPLPVSSASSIKVPALEQKKMLHLLGLTYVNADFFSSTIGGIAFTFVNKLVSGFRPETEQWDLEEWSHLPLASAQCLKLFHCICPDLFLLDYGQASTVRWKLAVMNAEDALYVCRLAPCLNKYDIAHKLVQQGM